MEKKCDNFSSFRQKIIYCIILIVISLIALIGLCHPGLPITNDGKDHVARIANFYQNLHQGIPIPRWAGNLNWGYGHPILEFLYPLPSYVASLIHVLGVSFIDATKIVFAIGMVFSGMCMYLWLVEFLDVPAAFIGGLLYVFTPYRFVEVYVRGDIGENLAYVFMPLTLFFIYKMYKRFTVHSSRFTEIGNLYVLLGAFSLACLILSHNAISLMYLPFIIFYCAYLIYISNNKKYLILNTIYLILFGFALSAFFWLPGLLEGKYTLRNILTADDYKNRFISFASLMYSSWNYDVAGRFTKQLGIVNWVASLGSLVYLPILWKQKNKQYIFMSGLIIYTLSAIFLMLPYSRFIWDKITLLQNFQFPWRFLAIPVFTTSVLGATLVSEMKKEVSVKIKEKNNNTELYAIRYLPYAILVLAILFFNKDFWFAKGYMYQSDSHFSGIYNGTTDTGESSPIWSIRFMEHTYKAPLEVISGRASIMQVQRTVTKHIYTITAATKTQLLENTVYFPGWEIFVDKVPVSIQYQDPHNRGLMTFFVPEGTHTIQVQYTETKLRTLADLISLFSVLIIVIFLTTSYIYSSYCIRRGESV